MRSTADDGGGGGCAAAFDEFAFLLCDDPPDDGAEADGVDVDTDPSGGTMPCILALCRFKKYLLQNSF